MSGFARRHVVSAAFLLSAALASGPALLRATAPASAPAPAPSPASQALSAPSTVVLDVSEHVVEGDARAPLTLVEFSDYQCDHCARHHRETWPRIAEAFVKTGKLRRVFFDLPLRKVHPFAFRAARAARCAGEQGRFLEMQKALFSGERGINQWAGHAAAAGVEPGPLLACLDTSRHAGAVREDIAAAALAGVEEVPVFLLARTDPIDPDSVTGVSWIVGAAPFARFERAILETLPDADSEKKP